MSEPQVNQPVLATLDVITEPEEDSTPPCRPLVVNCPGVKVICVVGNSPTTTFKVFARVVDDGTTFPTAPPNGVAWTMSTGGEWKIPEVPIQTVDADQLLQIWFEKSGPSYVRKTRLITPHDNGTGLTACEV